MNNKNVLLTIVAVLMAVVIGSELCVYFGYDLYFSENGVFVRHKAYIATYENMSESELRQKAETGDADAMAMLGANIYDTHRETEYNKLLEFAQKSADKNCARGKNLLAILYDGGICVPQNPQKAFELYKEAANGNFPAAFYNICSCYFNGKVVPKDIKEGFKYLEKSALQGLPFAQYSLGMLYLSGDKEIKKDVCKGVEWLTLAADQNAPDAQYELSKIYYKGEGENIAPDYNKAKDLCKKAAESGLPEAKWALENKFNSKND